MEASTGPAPALATRSLYKSFRVDGRLTRALDGISLEVQTGEFVTVIGPSGSGKSTLLNVLCGLLRPDRGQVLLYGEPVRDRDLLGRVAYMPQRDLLLPWRSVLDNVLLGPEIAGQDLPQAREEAREALAHFGLAGFEDNYPATLSGGMRQRAALLRTFLCRQEVVLLDEPLGALDALTRLQLRQWLLDVWSAYRRTVLFVTHDVDEAVAMSDRVYVFSPRPATVVAELAIDLPRPRSRDTTGDSRFALYRRALLEALGL